jgi:hypothetical protein
MENMVSTNKVVPVGMPDYLLKKTDYLNKQRIYRQKKKIAPLNLEKLYEPTQPVDQGKLSYNFTAFYNMGHWHFL